jgi:hypothetical protein
MLDLRILLVDGRTIPISIHPGSLVSDVAETVLEASIYLELRLH